MIKGVCKTCTNKLCVRKVSVFKNLTDMDMLEIVKLTEHLEFSKGDYLFHEGDKLAKLFIVNLGKVKLSKFNSEGREQILSIHSDGMIFGEFHLFNEDEPFNYTAIALSDLKICTLTKKNMDYLLSKHPSINQKILIELSKKLIQTENLAKSLSTINTDTKVAYVLHELSKDHGIFSEDKIRIEMPINREEMANYAGITRETMSRKLKSLSESGIIELVGNKVIIIHNIKKLNELI